MEKNLDPKAMDADRMLGNSSEHLTCSEEKWKVNVLLNSTISTVCMLEIRRDGFESRLKIVCDMTYRLPAKSKNTSSLRCLTESLLNFQFNII